MPDLQFDPQSIYPGNIKKYDGRLTPPMMKFNDRGMIFVTWYQVRDDDSVYDVGFGQSDELLGHNSGIRYNKIEHLGVSLMNETDVNVNEEVPGVLDISQEGSILIFPNTITPNPDKDYFMIEHMEMRAVFRITGVDYDHMRVDGYRKCDYILEGTDAEIVAQLEKQTVETFEMNYPDFGTDLSPIVRKDHLDHIRKLEYMVNDMIHLYLSIFYNERHECLLWYDMNTNKSVYDECLQHFVSTNSLLSIPNSNHITYFEHKLEEPTFSFLYNRSMWRWIERDSPKSFLERFRYTISSAERYIDSSFHSWGHLSFSVLWPCSNNTVAANGSYLDERMIRVLSGIEKPRSSYEQVMYLYVSGKLTSPEQIPLTLYQELVDGINEFHLFAYTPIIIYIIRKAVKFR